MATLINKFYVRELESRDSDSIWATQRYSKSYNNHYIFVTEDNKIHAYNSKVVIYDKDEMEAMRYAMVHEDYAGIKTDSGLKFIQFKDIDSTDIILYKDIPRQRYDATQVYFRMLVFRDNREIFSKSNKEKKRGIK